MNWLLWRSEYSAGDQAGAPVPPAAVWERIITAADSSSLEIYQRGQKVGACRWMVTVGGERPRAATEAGDDTTPDGMIRKVTGYTLDFDGNAMFKELGFNLRFNFRTVLDDPQRWREVNIRLAARPYSWEVQAEAAAEKLVLRLADEQGQAEFSYQFADLARPEKILQDFEVPAPLAALAASMLPSVGATNLAQLTPGLRWEARTDSLRFGRSAIRAYRLQARLFDRYHARLYVSRAGELLRVELPGDIVMVNHALMIF